eukprot:15348891-Ditylum_brightwellii.AAC.1
MAWDTTFKYSLFFVANREEAYKVPIEHCPVTLKIIDFLLQGRMKMGNKVSLGLETRFRNKKGMTMTRISVFYVFDDSSHHVLYQM